jgi:uncharacterized protein YndB with AHSA1/START domain
VGDTEIHTERIFQAPKQLVWDTFNDPNLIPEWWGLRSSTTRVETMDVRPGGKWRFVEVDSDGNENGFSGEFREINPPDSITQTFEWDGMPGHVIVETAYFEEIDANTTRLRGVSVFANVGDRDGMLNSGMEVGANESHDRFEELLARIAA